MKLSSSRSAMASTNMSMCGNRKESFKQALLISVKSMQTLHLQFFFFTTTMFASQSGYLTDLMSICFCTSSLITCFSLVQISFSSILLVVGRGLQVISVLLRLGRSLPYLNATMRSCHGAASRIRSVVVESLLEALSQFVLCDLDSLDRMILHRAFPFLVGLGHALDSVPI